MWRLRPLTRACWPFHSCRLVIAGCGKTYCRAVWEFNKLLLSSAQSIALRITTHHLSPFAIAPTMTSNAANDPEILAHVQRFWDNRKPSSPIYQFLLGDIKLTYASKGVIRAQLPLTKNHVNTHGSIHGSVSATLVDWVGGLAIAAWDNRDKAGVSTDIHISYLSGAKDGDTIEIEGRANKVGGTLAFTTATVWKLVDGKPGPVVATGSHTKFIKI
jgi:acyl-coenzyme A thioesterase 13